MPETVRGAEHRLASAAAVLLITIAWLMTGAIAVEALETETFRVTPHPRTVQGDVRRGFTVNLQEGMTTTDAVHVTNKTDTPIRLRVYAADAVRNPETGGTTVASSAATPRGIGSWVTIERSELALLPHMSEVVRFAVTRPEGVSAAGDGAIVVEQLHDSDGAGIDVVYRLALLVRLDGEAGGISVAEPRLEMPIGLVPSTGTTSATVTNDTLQPVDTTVRFEVESLTGRVWPLDPVEVRLDPGESRDVTQDWTTVPRWGGILQVEATAHWEAGSVSTTSPRRVYPPLWMLAVLIGLTGIRAIRIMWDDRRRRRRPTRGESPPPLPQDETPAEEREPALV